MTNLTFQNPVELDLRLLTTFGTSVKEGPNPFGQFGTGLKYALAGIARLDGQVDLFIGEKLYRLRKNVTTIRGKDFDQLFLTEIDVTGDHANTYALPFTTELGKHWAPWMLYRELLANVIDEGGTCWSFTAPPHEGAGWTTITVSCPELESLERSKFWIEDEMPRRHFGLDLEAIADAAGEKHLFYRGFRVTPESQVATKWAYRWNLLSPQTLSEDRMLVSSTAAKNQIASALAEHATQETWEYLQSLDWNPQELQLDFNHWDAKAPCQAFSNYWLRQIRQKKPVPYAIRQLLKKFKPEELQASEDDLVVPLVYTEMLKEEPRLQAAPRAGDLYSFLDDVEKERKELLAQVKFWKACTQGLALLLHQPLGGEAPKPEEDSDPQGGDEIPY